MILILFSTYYDHFLPTVHILFIQTYTVDKQSTDTRRDTMEYLLEVQHLNKNLNTFALHDISFTLKPGFITGLIGQNGCGKTSLIKTILNLYEKDSGAVFVTGHSMENEEIAAKDQLGVVLDECLFDADTRVETNARCFGALYSRYDHRLFLEFCRRFDVDPKKKIGKLSKGQKARFQLAFAFSHDAKVFLMDEPAGRTGSSVSQRTDGIYAGNRGGRHEKHSFFPPISPKIWIRSEITFF